MDIPTTIYKDADGSCSLNAPCKINLGLKIFPPRSDGFHDLESWMVPVSWHDTITYTPGGPARISVTGRSTGIPTELEKNLIGKAMIKLAATSGKPLLRSNADPSNSLGGELKLHKVVPPGGGLGGGSSDAAQVLILLNLAWNLQLAPEKLVGIAAELGSDVPFFIPCKPALCTGRGEKMELMPPSADLHCVLIVPEAGLATKPVYQAFDAGFRPHSERHYDWNRWSKLSAQDLNDVLMNDLEPPAFHLVPWLAELKEKAARSVEQKVHMTGSGSTLYTLTDSPDLALELGMKIKHQLGNSVECVPVRILPQRE